MTSSVLALLLAAAVGASAPGSTGPGSTGPAGTTGLDGLFQAGVERYAARDYDGAIAEWEKLRRFRVVHPALELNLGSAYFERQQYGLAVLHWQRARRLDPQDARPNVNLSLVGPLLIDDLTPPPGAVRAVFAHVCQRVPAGRAVAFAAIAWNGLGIVTLIALLGSGRIRRVAVVAAGLLAVVMAVVGPFAWYQVREIERTDDLVVLAPVVEARSGAGERYTPKFTVHEGLVVRRIGRAPGWEWVVLPNQVDGWLPAATVEGI